jgi:hypothetical protein
VRLFLDANILFSAARSAGGVRRLVDAALADGHELVIDDFVLAEARRNLDLESGPGAIQSLGALLSRLTLVAGGSQGGGLARVVSLPEKDLPVLAAAIRSDCAILVTGDRTHFGPLWGRTIRGVWIGSPRSVAERLFGK